MTSNHTPHISEMNREQLEEVMTKMIEGLNLDPQVQASQQMSIEANITLLKWMFLGLLASVIPVALGTERQWFSPVLGSWTALNIVQSLLGGAAIIITLNTRQYLQHAGQHLKLGLHLTELLLRRSEDLLRGNETDPAFNRLKRLSGQLQQLCSDIKQRRGLYGTPEQP